MFDRFNQRMKARSAALLLSIDTSLDQILKFWLLLAGLASANTGQVVQLAPTSELQNGEFPAAASTFPAIVAANSVNGGFNGHAIIADLKEDTVYSYRVGGDGAWSAAYQF